MVKLNRFTMPVFAGNAAQTQTSVFGTMKTSPQYTTDVAASIGTTAYGNGWADAIEIGYAPYMEDMNTLQRAITYQISYNQQQGIPEWDANTEYYKGSLAKLNTANGSQVYSSLIDNNVGNLVSNATKWKLLFDTENSYVTTNTAQTITREKTFSNDFSVLANSIKISSTGTNCNYPLSFQLPSFTKGDTPANNVIAGIDFYGSARTNFSDRLSNIDFMVDTSKNSSIDIRAYDCSTSASTDAAGLSVHYDANGNTYALCPAPSLASNASNYSKQIVNISYLNGASSGVVHLTGNETITGLKTIRRSVDGNNNITMLDLVNNSITNGTNPSSNSHTRIYFSDKDAHATACIYNNFESNGENGIVLQALKSETVTPNLTRSFTQLGLYYPATGNPYATAPASDVNGSIVTTKSHGENYVEFGNGYILQKGTFTYASSSGTVDVPLDKTMTTTTYAVIVMMEGTVRNDMGAVTARATNKFTFKSNQYSGTGNAMYIVFGK